MKVAVSIPDETFRKADTIAKRLALTRSAFYALALDAMIAKSEISLTDQINAALDEVAEDDWQEQEAFLRAGAATVLKHTEW